MVLPVVGQALVEGTVLLLCDVGRVASPERFRLVELLVLNRRLFDLLGLFLFLLLFLVYLLDLGLLLTFLLLLDLLVVLDLLQIDSSVNRVGRE